MAREIELKLTLPKRSLPALRRHPLIAGSESAGPAVTLENTYYDTAELQLKDSGIAIRTRRQGRRWLQTVKAAAASAGGLSSRPEWEQPYDIHQGFDFSLIDAAEIRKRLERHADTLMPVFNTRFRRETRIYVPGTGKRILIMIDSGTVSASSRQEEISELELELAEGSPSDLLEFARLLAADLPLLPEDASKAERGYRLHLDQPRKPLRAGRSAIHRDMTPVEAFRSLAADCMRQWQANAAGASQAPNPEFIHQLRVSQRRLRSLIGLFAPALPEAFVQYWASTLKENAGRFDDARDLDVLEDELLHGVEAASPHETRQLGLLRDKASSERAAARSRAAAALDPAEQGRLLLHFNADLHALPTNNLIGSVDLGAFAALQLERLRKRARRRYVRARGLVPEDLHNLRIAFKRLRYGADFFAPLLPQKTITRYLAALAKLQNALGFINDLDVARQRFALWGENDADLREAAAYVCGWHGKRYAKLSRRSVRKSAPLLVKASPWVTLLPARPGSTSAQ